MQHRRTEDVPGVEEFRSNVRDGIERPVVIDGDEISHGSYGVFGGIQRRVQLELPFRVFGGLFLDVLVVLLLDIGAVQKDDLRDVTGGVGGINVSVEALLIRIGSAPE